MADNFITVAEPDATQKKLASKTFTVGANSVHFEGIFQRGPDAAVVSRTALDAAASAQILVANPARARAIVTNETAVFLYVKYGTAASATSYTHRLGPGECKELPVPAYLGVIHAIPASGTGFAQVTEETWE